MISIKNKGKTDDYVYDISLDGTVVNALGLAIASNTDGFNFQMPKTFRYTKENPYIGKGLGRNTKEGKAYTEVEADVAEFEDTFLNKAYNGGVNKMGLGIDEYCPCTINVSRKNYFDLLEDGKVKMVGNTLKSKKMPGYIEKFMTLASELLLNGKGKEFLENYYSYIERIYNFQIPLKDIASKGKIKKTLKEYIEDCNSVTKAGTKKSRQAWYELLLREENPPHVDVGDTIYYINTGTKKSDADVKKTTSYYLYHNGEKTDVTKDLNRVYNRYKKEAKLLLEKLNNNEDVDKNDIDEKLILNNSTHKYEIKYPKLEYFTDDKKNDSFINSRLCAKLIGEGTINSEDNIFLNCKLIPRNIAESEEDIQMDDIEYNAIKYIEQFNKRIKPLLVCFKPEIREKILIMKPDEMPYFTDEESQMDSGHPNKVTDQDTYEQLMTMDRKEVEFWTKVNKKPPFVEECGIDWENVKDEFFHILEKEKDEKFKILDNKYINCLNNLTKDEIEAFLEEGDMPNSLLSLVYLKEDGNDLRFYFKDLPDMTPSTGGYMTDDITYDLINANAERKFEEFVMNNVE